MSKLFKFSPFQTKYLINLWGEKLKESNANIHVTRKSVIFAEITCAFNEKYGTNLLTRQIEKKIAYEKARYNRLKSYLKKIERSGENKNLKVPICSYYDEIDEILGIQVIEGQILEDGLLEIDLSRSNELIELPSALEESYGLGACSTSTSGSGEIDSEPQCKRQCTHNAIENIYIKSENSRVIDEIRISIDDLKNSSFSMLEVNNSLVLDKMKNLEDKQERLEISFSRIENVFKDLLSRLEIFTQLQPKPVIN